MADLTYSEFKNLVAQYFKSVESIHNLESLKELTYWYHPTKGWMLSNPGPYRTTRSSDSFKDTLDRIAIRDNIFDKEKG